MCKIEQSGPAPLRYTFFNHGTPRHGLAAAKSPLTLSGCNRAELANGFSLFFLVQRDCRNIGRAADISALPRRYSPSRRWE